MSHEIKFNAKYKIGDNVETISGKLRGPVVGVTWDGHSASYQVSVYSAHRGAIERHHLLEAELT